MTLGWPEKYAGVGRARPHPYGCTSPFFVMTCALVKCAPVNVSLATMLVGRV